jgi:opacity protein-like surface antigen
MRRLLLLGSLALFALVPSTLSAQWSLGGQLNYGTDFDFALGARVAWGWPFEPGAETVASFDLFFPSDDRVDYWEVNVNINQPLPIGTDQLNPYVGAGLNWAHVTVSGASDNRFGLNLLAGLKYATPSVTPFGEVRAELGGGKQWVFTGGVMFIL